MKIQATTLLLLVLNLSLGCALCCAQGEPETFISELESDLAVVTEVSLTNPFVGQQFSIVYRLRVRRPPTAVDINPQQFPGFWAEIVPLPGQSKPVSSSWKGRKATDFLLRQIIAFPLIEGELKLPSLILKIRKADNRSAGQDVWDVFGRSDAVSIIARAIPYGGPLSIKTPFVGDVSGAMSVNQGAREGSVTLEIEGSANLAFFQPKQWIHVPADLNLVEELLSSETFTQTSDIGGVRTLSALQRQRWALHIFPETFKEIAIGNITLPTYDPIALEWRTVEIEGLSLEGSQSPISAQTSNNVESNPMMQKSATGTFNWQVLLGLMFIVTMISGAAVWIRKKIRSQDRQRITIPLLEKRMQKSPRSFLDGAHKLMAQYARQYGCSLEIGKGDDLADRCWQMIERYRFNVEPPPVEVRAEIMNTLKVLVSKPVPNGND